MVEPVISSRFGTRPILEVPAMQVSGKSSLEVPSLQSPIMNPVSNISPIMNPVNNIVTLPAPSPMLMPGMYNPPYAISGLPPGPLGYPGLERKHQSAPAGPFYSPQGREFYYGPNGEIIFPPPVYHPNNHLYPGVANSYTGYAGMPPPAPVRIPYPNYGMMTPGFNITCELEYGRVMNINVRDSDGEFRGIPEFLRTELTRTYGAYPYTEVKIKLEGGEFHIYATHENRRNHGRRRHCDSDSDSDSDRCGPYPEWKSDVESYTSGVRPRNPGDRPRGIVRERGWNRFR